MRDILRAASKTGGGSAVSMVLGAVASKLIAVVAGPGGLGLYSMLNQIQQTTTTAGTMGGGTALVQGLASKENDARDDYLTSVFWIFLSGAIAVAVGLVILAPLLAPAALGRDDPETIGIIRWLSIPAFLGVMYAYMTGVLNGFRAIGRLAISQVAVAAVAAALAYPVSDLVNRGYDVAFVGLLSIMMLGGLALGFAFALRAGLLTPFRRHGMKFTVGRGSARHFFSIAVITLVTGLVATVSLLVIRSLIVQYQGLSGAGIFNAAWTLGMTYPMVVLTSFGTYYLPTLSRTNDPEQRIVLMTRVFRITTFVMVPIVIMALVINPFIVSLLYSGEFASSLDTVRWMLIADYLKATSWVLSMPILAYADMRTYLWTETLWYAAFLGFGFAAMAQFGDIQVIGFGFLVLYLLYLLYVLYYSRTRHRFTLSKRTSVAWFAGMALIAVAAVQTWTYTSVNWLVALVWAGVSVAFVLAALTANERRSLFALVHLKGS